MTDYVCLKTVQKFHEFPSITQSFVEYQYQYLIFSIVNSVHVFPNKVTLRTLGNQKMKRRFQNWVEMQASVQSLLKKLIFGNSGEKLCKIRYESFLVLSNFLDFPNFPDLRPPNCTKQAGFLFR